MRLSEAPARAEVLARYRPVRAAIQAVLRAAVDRCRKADFTRAAKHLALWDQSQLDDDTILDMMSDIALMEPNQRGRRVYDGFLTEAAAALPPAERAIAERMAGATFSIFRIADWHEAAGVWIEDLLRPERRLWLLDESLEGAAPEGLTVAMRIFDAGPFHAGFGIAVVPADDIVGFCVEAASAGRPPPVRHSLAAAFYGEDILRAALVRNGGEARG